MMRTLLLSLIFLVLAFSGCTRDEPLKIGFVGSITGKNSDLGVAGRDAVLLAVEKVNNSGGINGRKLELLVRDDAQNPETAANAVENLVGQKVVAIVGPMGSAMAKAALPVASRAKTVMVSPTSSSNELSGKDDYFFRVMEPNQFFARHLAETCVKLKIRRVAAICDQQNQTYTVDILEAFRAEFSRRGGVVGTEVIYDSSSSPAFLPLVQKLGLNRVDGVMVLANSVDAINIGQQIRKINPQITILSGACGIAQRDLVQQAGKSIDNIIFTLPVNNQCSRPGFLAFRETFINRFNYQPTFAAVLAYDAAEAVIAALRQDADPARLKETMVGMKAFTGLQGEIALDRFGDPNRQLFIIRYAEGREEVIE